MQAVILAGGLGERLRPLTEKIPKPMAPVLGRPYLEYQINWLKSEHISSVLMLTGYLGEKIKDYFKDGASFGINITYSQEHKPMGTGGGLKLAQEELEPYFALINGDSFLPIDFAGLEKFFIESGKTGVAVVYDNRSRDTGVLNNMQMDEYGVILKYRKNSPDPELNFVDAGVMVFKKEITDFIPPDRKVSLEDEILPLLIKKNELSGYISKRPFYDIGTQERLGRFEEAVRSNSFNMIR